MKIAMIDLETMGSSPRAAVCAIGAICFESHGDGLYQPSFDVTVSLQAQEDGIDEKTLYWWLEQTKEAQRYLLDDRKGLLMALSLFRTWYMQMAPDFAMAYGASFDFPILEHACRRVNQTSPINYRDALCFRTLTRLYPDVPRPETEGVTHRAVDDAWSQARWAQDIFKKHLKTADSDNIPF
jgi:hypothetical protein